MISTGWMEQAACAGHDPERWFPTAKGRGAIAQAQPAMSICDACPVREKCAEYAKANGIPCGVWGGELRSSGLSGAKRYGVKKKFPAPHGTNAGYERHRRLKERPCDDCRQGHAIYRAEWAAAREVSV